MGLLKRKMTNTASASIDSPSATGPTTVHHHGVNWPLVVAVAFLCIILLGPAFWLALVFLLDRLGSTSPESHAAGLLIFTPLGFGVLWFASWIIGPHLDRHYAHLDFEAEQKTERERVRLLAAQTTLPVARMTQADYEFAQVIVGVMMLAYDDAGKLIVFKGRGRPWSINGALSVAKSVGVTISQDKAGEVQRWLRKHDIVVGALEGQVNSGFDNLSKVRAVIDKEYDKPILVTTALSTLRENAGYVHI
jgi:hypothetical protein